MNSPTLSPYTSLCLKFVGLILILSSLIDYLTLVLSLNWQDLTSQITFASSLVDRGIVPMVGMCFLLVGYWMGASDNSGAMAKLDIRLPAFILSCLLALIFFLIVPLHLNNLAKANEKTQTQIETGANEAEARIKTQFDQLTSLSKNPEQLKTIDANITQITQAISTGTYNGKKLGAQEIQQLEQNKTQLEGFRVLAKDKKKLDERLTELQTQLKSQKQERKNTTNTEVLKQALRTGLSSLMLAIGYTIIGWFGMKSMGTGDVGGAPSIRKPKAR
jgi:ABC-type multidrug transport system fused ATPase/permease subunit